MTENDFQAKYADLLGDPTGVQIEKVIAYLAHELPYFWLDEYLAMTAWTPNVQRVRNGSFEYIFDAISDSRPGDSTVHDRLIGAIGITARPTRRREKSRIRGWIGKTEAIAGSAYDKGHFIAHSIGGTVDGSELNLFWQQRAFNRGRSVEGKAFRNMERYAAGHEGTLCFNRPIYSDDYSVPASIEYGILKPGNELWVHRFRNE